MAFYLCKKKTYAVFTFRYSFRSSFFVVTQAQTSGFEKFFIRTILGTNGAIRISDKFQDTFGTVEKVDDKEIQSFTFILGKMQFTEKGYTNQKR